MKKLFLLVLTCSLFAVGTANAQSETYYGGKQGSFAITFGADPVINFVGNMFNGTQDNKLSDLGGTLVAKYMLGDQFAIKAGVVFNNAKMTNLTYNPEDKDYKDIINKETEGSREFQLNLGVQYNFRAGKRLQPFVGADLFYGRMNSEYSINEDFDTRYEDEWGNEYEQYDAYEKKSSPINAFGFVANLGVEYFLGKHVSVSAALDLSFISYNKKEVSKFKTDDRDYTNAEIDARNYNIKTIKGSGIKTGLMNGNIAFNFYL
ncbi:MAG: outer membrane beta-barrel protein [Bacteroidaceae bacterium]|nr:outer membrane beta-barrel protein [Bacteroidaceae bacterium]